MKATADGSPPAGTPAAEGRSYPTWADRLLRRGLKFAGLLALVYYDLPAKVLGEPVYWAFPLGAAVLAGVEVARLRFHLPVPAIRPYERGRLASYVYWAAALGLLVAFFPEALAVAVLVAAALADSLVGEARRSESLTIRASRPYTFLAFALPCALLLGGLRGEPWAIAAVFGAVGGLLAATVEGRVVPGLDDDLLMPLLPALVLLLLAAVVPGSSPLVLHLPWLARG